MQGELHSRLWRWTELRREIGDRFREPLDHPTFVFYFLFVVFGLGCVGTWVELFKLIFRDPPPPSPYEGLITSLVTFFFALIGTSCTQISIAESGSKALKTLAQGILLISVVGVVLATAGVGNGIWASVAWGLASLVALVVWWIANARSSDLKDPDTPTGGSLHQNLPGTLTGYKT